MKKKVSITILGGGNGAFAAAADLSIKGHDVRLLEIPELSKNVQPVIEINGIELINKNVTEFESGFANINIVTTDPQVALDGSEIILFIVPGFAENQFSNLILPYLNHNQLVVFFCGIFGGALEFRNILESKGIKQLPLIAETEALIYGAIKINPATVSITSRKQGLAVAGLPSKDTDIILKPLRKLFPDLKKAANVIETGLRNANIILHPPVAILNASRMSVSSEKFRFYWDGVTEPVGRVMEILDRERLEVGNVLDLQLPSIKDRLIDWYGNQGASGETLGEIVSKNPAYKNVIAPQTLNHRFITEDVPFGLVPIESLGFFFNISTPVTTALINLANELLSTDFRKKGRNIERLGLQGIDHSLFSSSL